MVEKIKTYFAPAERSSIEDVKRSFEKIIQLEHIKKLLNSTTNFATILNNNRQVVYVNNALQDFLKVDDIHKLLGMRPGEAISCIHCWDTPEGCGTGINCKNCGAAQAIVESQKKNIQVTKECRITSNLNNEEISLDLSVTATPLDIDDDKFTIVMISDISDKKRKEVLERIFFHDVLNTATSIYGFMRVIGQLEEINEIKELVPIVEKASNTLIDQINEHKELILAESGDLEITLELINTNQILNECSEVVSKLTSAKNKTLKMDPESVSIDFQSCNTVLKRILINLLKNALEASKPEETITYGCNVFDNTVILWVHNNIVMDESVQSQIFKRSFSTKGFDRGIGAYSVKLLTEKYLKGKVHFTSVEPEGTTFYVELNQID